MSPAMSERLSTLWWLGPLWWPGVSRDLATGFGPTDRGHGIEHVVQACVRLTQPFSRRARFSSSTPSSWSSGRFHRAKCRVPGPSAVRGRSLPAQVFASRPRGEYAAAERIGNPPAAAGRHVCQRAETSLQCRPLSVTTGRHFVAQTLSSWGVETPDPACSSIGDVLLVAAELVGNAVQASSRPITMLVETHRDHIHIGVQDDSPERAAIRRADRGSARGRGLVIVDAVSDRWGQSKFHGTKWVWANVRIARGSVLAIGCHQ